MGPQHVACGAVGIEGSKHGPIGPILHHQAALLGDGFQVFGVKHADPLAVTLEGTGVVHGDLLMDELLISPATHFEVNAFDGTVLKGHKVFHHMGGVHQIEHEPPAGFQ